MQRHLIPQRIQHLRRERTKGVAGGAWQEGGRLFGTEYSKRVQGEGCQLAGSLACPWVEVQQQQQQQHALSTRFTH